MPDHHARQRRLYDRQPGGGLFGVEANRVQDAQPRCCLLIRPFRDDGSVPWLWPPAIVHLSTSYGHANSQALAANVRFRVFSFTPYRKGDLNAVFVALATEKMDAYVGGSAIIGAMNCYAIAHNLLSESGNND